MVGVEMRLQLVVMSCCVAAAVCVATDVFLCSGALDGLSVVMCDGPSVVCRLSFCPKYSFSPPLIEYW